MAFDETLSSSVQSIEHLFKHNQFVPAGIQRSYQWEEREVKSLLQDLQDAIAASKPPPELEPETEDSESEEDAAEERLSRLPVTAGPRIYFLGQMVASRNEDGVLAIYDGLQRLTTLTILICVLRDMIRKNAYRRQLHALVTGDKGEPRLSYPVPDKTLLREIQNMGETARTRTSPPRTDLGRRLRQATQVLRREVARIGHDDRLELADYLLNQAPVSLLIVEDHAVARQIFIATNMRGRPLEQEDLFMGQLCDLAKTPDEEQKVAETYRQMRGKMGPKFVHFMRAVDMIERRKPAGEAYLSDLADVLGDQYREENITRWMGRLGHFKGAWDDLEKALEDPRHDPTDGHLWRLGLVKWHEWRGPALNWLAAYQKALSRKGAKRRELKQSLTRRMSRLQRTAVAMTVAEMTKAERTSVMARAIMRSDRRHQTGEHALVLNSKFCGKAAYRLGEHGIRSATGQVLMRWWESILWESRLKSRHIDIGQATLEHILPQNPGPAWFEDFPDRKEREACTTMIGNLAALDGETNHAIENFDFSAKRVQFLKARSTFKTLDAISREDRWTAAAVRKRTQTLASLIWAEFQLPDVPSDELKELARQAEEDALEEVEEEEEDDFGG